MLAQLRQVLRTHLLPRRHTSLLVALVVLFAARPLTGNAGIAPLVFSLALLSVLLVALYTVQVDELVGEREVLVRQKRRRNRIAWLLAVPAVLERVLATIAPSHRAYLLGAIFWWLALTFVTLNQLRNLLRQKEVTGEIISMAIAVYLLLGISWGIFYIVIFLYDPLSFNLGGFQGGGEVQAFPIFFYFSLTTLSTIGFGDITPLSLQARYAAVAEGIVGQFYLAILVARLVALQMSETSKETSGR
jgi:voltage-gated potassium channel